MCTVIYRGQEVVHQRDVVSGVTCLEVPQKYGEFVQRPTDYKRLFHGAIQFPLQRRLVELQSGQQTVHKAQNSLKSPSVFLFLHLRNDLTVHP
jgi:hypothetical protein